MVDQDTVRRPDGVVLPPPEAVARYRAEGLWTDTLLPDLVLAHAADRPAAIAVSDAVQRLTCLGAAGRGGRARGRKLADAGLGRDDRVLLRLPNSVELVVTLLA